MSTNNKYISYNALYIYVIFTINGTIPLLVDYHSQMSSPSQELVLQHLCGVLDILKYVLMFEF
jgi:hypothetical protein